jgi:hypothetical protein
MTLQQIIDERISFLKEQINQDNKPEVNKTFQVQIDAIRSVDDIEKVDPIILEKKALLKNSKDVHESDRLLAELDGLEWLQRQIERYSKKSMKQRSTMSHDCYCSICGKRLKFSSPGRSEYPLSCWKCMIVNADS